MKATRIFMFGLAIILCSLTVAFVTPDRHSIGKINFILGSAEDVEILRAGKAQWESAKLYSAIFDGDRLKTKQEARCETRLRDQSVIRIGENTTFTFKQNQLNSDFNAEITKGRIWANIRKLSRRTKFQVRTPTAVCSIRGTIYRIDADSTTKVMVYQGAVDVGPLWAVKRDTAGVGQQKSFQPPYEVPGPTQVPGPFEVTLEQWVRIVAGFQIEVRPDGKYAKSRINKNVDDQDEWVAWNKQRDGIE